MNSSTHRKLTEEQRQAEIKKQIALLQAQLVEPVTSNDGPDLSSLTSSPKRKQDEHTLLAPSTPSPKRRKLNDNLSSSRKPNVPPPLPSLHSQMNKHSPSTKHVDVPQSSQALKPSPSTVLSKLARLASSNTDVKQTVVNRSSAFSDRPAVVHREDTSEYMNDYTSGPAAHKRDDNLALIEDLTLGPVDHAPPFNDPQFQKLEPNSGIRLSSRSISHEDFQDYLRGRYYLSPSKLYSVIRLLPNKQGYDIPVEGDWVAIAVIAERGPMKYSKAPVGVGRDDQEQLPEKDDTLDDLSIDAGVKSEKPYANKWKGKAKVEDNNKPTGKKYINLKLIDFGCRSGSSSATGGKSIIRGDAFLSLLLFEADRVEEFKDGEGKKQKVYRGGSRGAFERMSMLKEGSVVALLNPRILKPFQRSGDAPHPTDNILAITPESIDSTVIIGHSQDLGMCKAVKRDGKVCGSWCDKRVSDVCDWHIQHAVKQKRAGRSEFAMGTSGMSTGAKRKPAYDPTRQWGLKPDPDGASSSGATYVVSGHVVSGSVDPRTMYIGESMGRDAQAKAARKGSAQNADLSLQKLLKRDKEGMKAVVTAREFGKKMAKKGCAEDKDRETSKGKGKEKARKRKRESSDDEQDDEGSDVHDSGSSKGPKSTYSAQLIRSLGFDPTGKEGRNTKDISLQNKLDALATIQSSRGKINLGPRPGKKASSVRPPAHILDMHLAKKESADGASPPFSLPESDDELEQEEIETFGKTILASNVSEKMVDLDCDDE